MSNKLLGFIVMIWVFGAILGSTFEEHTAAAADWTGTDTTSSYATISTLEYLMNIENAAQETDLGIVSIPLPNDEYFKSIFRVATLQFSFISGDYNMFYYIVLVPFVVVAVVSLVILFVGMIRGNITWGS